MKGRIRMKATSSPSKFAYRFSDKKYYVSPYLVINTDEVRLYHFYITEDGAEIELDTKWHINPMGLVMPELTVDQNFWEKRRNYDKIIMSSDPELIADGIQGLDAIFMFWYLDEHQSFMDRHRSYIDMEKQENGKYKLIYPK